VPTHDPALTAVAEKLASGARLDAADGLALLQSRDLLAVGMLAAHERERRHGRQVSYIVNRHLNPTNVCALRCPLCAFSRDAADPDAYCWSVAEVLAHAEAAGDPPDEFHIVGGLHPDLPFAYALDLLAALRARYPHVALKAFTAVEIDHWAGVAHCTIEDCLRALTAAGLDGLTGGGAEIFAPRVRALIAPRKVSADRWLEVHGIAHGLGLPTTATMLYGHVETLEERVDHLLRLRAQQDRTGGFLACIPLAYQPAHTALGGQGTTGRDDVQTIAVARLLLDNIPNIKAYWPMLGAKTAQAAIAFGANDVDGTVVDERIGHSAGVTTPRGLTEAALRRLIFDGGGEPVRRNSRHQPLAEGATRNECPDSKF
jgi:aminodeoxyfutalosine synthase